MARCQPRRIGGDPHPSAAPVLGDARPRLVARPSPAPLPSKHYALTHFTELTYSGQFEAWGGDCERETDDHRKEISQPVLNSDENETHSPQHAAWLGQSQ